MRLAASATFLVLVGWSLGAQSTECPHLTDQQKAAVTAIVKDYSQGKISDAELQTRIAAIMPIECLEVAVPPEGH